MYHSSIFHYSSRGSTLWGFLLGIKMVVVGGMALMALESVADSVKKQLGN